MPAGQAEEIIALALVFVVHVIGGLMLVWALLDTDQRTAWRRRWFGGGGDDDERGPPGDPQPPPDGGSGARAPLPLPSGSPSRVRLREPVRVADAHPRPARRPGHPPAPERPRAPVGERRRRG